MSTYLFYNQKKDIKLFIDVDGADEAHKTLKDCKFKDKDHWKIYLKIGGQSVQTIGNK